MIGGGLFVGASYWYLYLTGEAGVRITFDTGSISTAVSGGAGPLKLEGQDPSACNPDYGTEGEEHRNGNSGGQNGKVVDGVSSGRQGGWEDRGGRGGSMGGGYGGGGGGAPLQGWLSELGDDGPYARTWMEREGKSRERKKEVNGEEKV